MEKLTEKEKRIFIDFSKIKDKPGSIANHLIKHINAGDLELDYQFPSLERLHLIMKVSVASVTEALNILHYNGYAEKRNGLRAYVKHPLIGLEVSTNQNDMIYANYHCKPPRSLTVKLFNSIQAAKAKHSRNTPPIQQNDVSKDLIKTCCNRVNLLHQTLYTPGHLYYVHDFQFLIRLIGLALKERRGVFVISKHSYSIIGNTLRSLKIKVIEVETDENGFCADELAVVCTKHKVTAVMLMSNANFPDTIDTVAARIDALLQLQKKYRFKIIENSAYEPWLSSKTNQVLEMAGDAIDSIIYLWPVSYLLEEISRIFFIAAHPDIIDKIIWKANLEGKGASQGIAFATNEVIQRKVFADTIDETDKAVLELKRIIEKVFKSSGFWKADGIRPETGPAFFLVPANGNFPPDVFEKLQILGISVVDPKLYHVDDEKIIGIRLDLTYYLGKKNLEPFLKKIERILKSMIS